MISFKKLLVLGGLGNQMFQYAFLRVTAERLGVKFFLPPRARAKMVKFKKILNLN